MKLGLFSFIIIAVLVTVYTNAQPSSSSSASFSSSSSSSSSSVNIIKVISGLLDLPIAKDGMGTRISDEITKKPYHRKDWDHWVDADHDCQTTRTEILLEQTSDRSKITYNDKVRKCSLKAGAWLDPYSNIFYYNPIQLDIDHVVPLGWAHHHGAADWPSDKKRRFANDKNNLLAVHFRLNRKKGDKGPDLWMPPNQEYRCEYIRRFDRTVRDYQLHYRNSEYRIVQRLLTVCNGR